MNNGAESVVFLMPFHTYVANKPAHAPSQPTSATSGNDLVTSRVIGQASLHCDPVTTRFFLCQCVVDTERAEEGATAGWGVTFWVTYDKMACCAAVEADDDRC